MTEVTREMILDYLIKKGGVVKNVDLVRHFRKYLQVEDPAMKDHAREVFKERVNSVASIRAEKGEKYLHLRPEIYKPQTGVTGLSSAKPPTGRTGNTGTDKASVSSGDDLSQLISDLLSPGANSTTSFSEFNSTPLPQSAHNTSPYHSSSEAGRGGASDSMYSRHGKNDVVLQSYKPLPSSSSTSSWGSATATPPYRANASAAPPTSYSRYTSPPPASTSVATPTASTSTAAGSSLFSPTSKSGTGDLGLGSLGGDLMSSFGDLFSSFGTSTSSSGLGGTTSSNGLGGTTSSNGLGGTSSSGLGGSTSNALGGTRSSGLGGTTSYSGLGGTSSTGLGGTTSSGVGGTSSYSGLGGTSSNGLGGTSSSSGLGGTSSYGGLGGTTSSGLGVTSSSSGLGGTSSSLLGGTGSSILDDIMSSSSVLGGGSGSSWASTPATTASQGQGQRSPRRAPPEAPTTQTTSSSISPQRTNSIQQGSPRRPPPSAPSGGISSSSIGSVGGVASGQQSSMRKSPSGSISSQGSPRRPPPGPPAENSTVLPPTTTSPRRAPPPAPLPKTTTSSSSIGSSGGATSSRNYNYEPPASSSRPPSSSSGSSVPSAYAKYGSPYHSSQQPPSTAPAARVMSPPRVTSPPKTSPSKAKTTETSRIGTSSATGSSLGGLGSLDFDLTSLPSFLDSSPKPPALKAVAPPVAPQSTAEKVNGPPAPTIVSSPSTVSSSVAPTVGGSSTSSGSSDPSTNLLHHQHLQLGPVVSAPTGKVGVADGTGRRQRSIDKTSRQYSSSEALREQTPPTIRVHGGSPTTRGSPDSIGMSPPGGREWRSKSPPYQSLGPHYDGRHRSHSSATSHVINGSISSSVMAVQLRNKDSKLRSSQANVRRSRNLEKRDPNLDSVTRLSIQMTPPTARRNKPEVAPKPSPKPTHRSREDLSIDGDDMSMTEMSEQESWEIDPLEKDWMLASAQGDIQGLQQLLLEEPNLINRKDFIHGYTALHWAAKHGRCDIIACLMLNGAQLDIKSNGLTPLHLAALSGYDNAIEQLIRDFGANVNTRDFGGRRPIDIISNKTTERSRALLSRLYNHGLPTRVHTPDHLFTFSQPHKGANDGRLTRNWSSLGDMVDKKVEHEKVHKRLPRMASIRKSFSIHSRKNKDYSPSKKDKRKRANTRPVSDAAAYAYNV